MGWILTNIEEGGSIFDRENKKHRDKEKIKGHWQVGEEMNIMREVI